MLFVSFSRDASNEYMGKRKLVALLNLSSWCLVMVERLFLAMQRGCLQFVIVVFPDHTNLLFFMNFTLLLLSYICIVTINVLWLFLTVPWVGLQNVIVVFPYHTLLLFVYRCFATIPTFHDIVSVILDLVSALAILQLLA